VPRHLAGSLGANDLVAGKPQIEKEGGDQRSGRPDAGVERSGDGTERHESPRTDRARPSPMHRNPRGDKDERPDHALEGTGREARGQLESDEPGGDEQDSERSDNGPTNVGPLHDSSRAIRRELDGAMKRNRNERRLEQQHHRQQQNATSHPDHRREDGRDKCRRDKNGFRRPHAQVGTEAPGPNCATQNRLREGLPGLAPNVGEREDCILGAMKVPYQDPGQTRTSAALVLALILASVAGVAQQKPKADAAKLFYKAFFFDQGERNVTRALELYRDFLREAPRHKLAPEAARYVVNLLSQTRQRTALAEFRHTHARLLESSYKPGINARFLDPNMDVAQIKAVFEGESREIFKHRKALIQLVGLKQGDSIADVGAGTGLFTWPFARAVGARGRVYAVELAPRFIERLEKLTKSRGLSQIRVIRCTERDTKLPAASIDVAFVCDTYHHFEFPKETIGSIRRALRPGGRLIVVDFERIPGKSREWLLGHVRANKETFRAEIESFGFEFVREPNVPLEENYVLIFQKKG